MVADSNAILYSLSYGSDFQPINPYLKAKVFKWMFFEQYSHEPYIAVRRFIRKYQDMPPERQAEF